MPGPSSHIERAVESQLRRDASIPAWQRDYVFHPTRKWELDFAWPELRVYLSIEGGVYRSSHRSVRRVTLMYRTASGELVPVRGTKDGLANDLEKHTEAAILGWIGVRATGSMVDSGLALSLLKRAIALRSEDPF